MRWLLAVFVAMLVGAGLMYVGFEYHLVRSSEGFVFVPKQQAALADCFVDIREWSFGDWTAHPQLAQSLSENGHGNLVRQSVTSPLLDNLLNTLDGAALEERGLLRE